MCEILVAINPDNYSTGSATKDDAGVYVKGCPVVVFEDGHKWGKEETLPKFIIIKVPGIPASTVKQYMEPRLGQVYTPKGFVTQAIYKRQYKIDADYIQEVIDAGGIATITQVNLAKKIIDGTK